MRQLIERMPAEQVLFASDWSAWPPPVGIEGKIRVYAEGIASLLTVSPSGSLNSSARLAICKRNDGVTLAVEAVE